MASYFDEYKQAVDEFLNTIVDCKGELNSYPFIKKQKDSSGLEYTIIHWTRINSVGDTTYDYSLNGAGVNVTMANSAISKATFSNGLILSNILSNNTQDPTDDSLIYSSSKSEVEAIKNTILSIFH